MVTPPRPGRAALVVARPWIGTAARLLLAGVLIASGWPKVTDLAASGRAVNAYRLMPYQLAQVIGAGLPFVELMLALLLLAGLAVRVAGTVTALLMLVYIGGISSVWARGLSIDCGCFGGGGNLAAGQHPTYLLDIIRDIALFLVALFLVVYPRTRVSVDGYVLGSEEQP